MFRCYKCNLEKPISEFHLNRNNKHGHNVRCKPCSSRRTRPLRTQEEKLAYKKAYRDSGKPKISYYTAKKEFIGLFGGKCLNCGYSKCLAALEFHHSNPKIKEFVINSTTLSRNKKKWEKFIVEAKKCVLLCSNCHAEAHHLANEIIYEHKSQKKNQDEEALQ